MWVNPDSLFLTSIIIALILVVITGFVWFFLRDHPASETRFKWTQYSRDFIAAEYVDRYKTTWTFHIRYWSKVILPSCRHEGSNRLVLNIPDGLTVEEFEAFISNCGKVDSTGHKVLFGLVNQKGLNRLRFDAIDNKVFSDFKKFIYEKALTP
ncbi:hypothetical protein pETSU_225 [Edwardsiella phage pEt-SU]|uniref:Uncharacterized protein n=1 Tax=Edwardsiella phage pEt-SU TaxID=2562142 RepID=A0A4D6DYD9_9CAUD|nr:hypothetical protein HOV39_gp225 [Edwardsiella phage pEt-SU]QBZ70806.1 hypothetical protein pETSU_225 [Edwardsiella phage pEt-SU]